MNGDGDGDDDGDGGGDDDGDGREHTHSLFEDRQVREAADFAQPLRADRERLVAEGQLVPRRAPVDRDLHHAEPDDLLSLRRVQLCRSAFRSVIR